MKIKIPNYLTIGRIIIVPFFVVTFFLPGFYGDIIPFTLFVIASFTDFLDGLLARMFKEESKLGELLDPIADKTLLLSAPITLTFIDCGNALPIFYTTLILSRELIQISGAIAIGAILGDIKVKHPWTGKFSTFMQVILIYSAFIVPSETVILYLAFIGGFFTFSSAALYIYAGLSQLPEEVHASTEVI